jgi:hypothetical protein
VIVMATIAKAISREPFSAASRGFIPASTCRLMFSSITIASSTTSPTASTIASRVSVLIEKPNAHISVKAPTSETGMVTSGTRVALKLRRKKKITRTTRPTASATAWNTLSIEAAMKIEES